MSGHMDLNTIIKSIAGSITQVAILSIAGYILSRKRIINSQSRVSFNEANNALFTPAFIFTRLAFNLKASQIMKLYIIIIGVAIVLLVSGILANLISRVFRLTTPDRKYCMLISMFMNSSALPVALSMSLIQNSGPKNVFQWGSEDTKDEQIGRTLAYIILFSTLGFLVQWSYGVRLLSMPQAEIKSTKNRKWKARWSCFNFGSVGNPDKPQKSDSESKNTELRAATECSSLSAVRSDVDVAVVNQMDVLSSSPLRSGTPPSSNSKAIMKHIFNSCATFFKALHGFMNPTLYSAIMAFLVIGIPKCQDFVTGLRPLRGALQFAGDVAVPFTLVILGAYFHSEEKPLESLQMENEPASTREHNLQKSRSCWNKIIQSAGPPSERSAIFIGIAVRQFLTPLVMIPILFALTHTASSTSPKGNVPVTHQHVTNDPCFILAMSLLVSAPTAITLCQMTTANRFPVGSPAYERHESHSLRFQRLISRTLFLSYIFFAPFTVIISVFSAVLIIKAHRQ
ncbi:auxin efflux carrier [Melampsora americana]|nr:auxin efflux carrier [Melampsora americana]